MKWNCPGFVDSFAYPLLRMRQAYPCAPHTPNFRLLSFCYKSVVPYMIGGSKLCFVSNFQCSEEQRRWWRREPYDNLPHL
jgi:hypothetical protein